MNETLPQIINIETDLCAEYPYIDNKEVAIIQEARQLFDAGFYSHALLDIWNAALNNLKRKVEAYGADMWASVVKSESGRKNYDSSGETIAYRWEDVDDLVLIKGASKLGILNPKAGKCLEMINWMRNHASPAHDSDNTVGRDDVIGLILLLQTNLFCAPIPEAAHAVKDVFAPVKDKTLDEAQIETLKDQMRSLRTNDIKTVFGFLLNMIIDGNEPSLTNAKKLFPVVWDKADTELRKTLGLRCHNYIVDPDSDTSDDKGAKTRVFELIVDVDAIKYIPEGSRAKLYRKAAAKMAKAKNTAYGWSSEEAACRMLKQLGPYVPSVAFEEVYQEILAIWCGNYWGHSGAEDDLEPFIQCLNSDSIRRIGSMFKSNERVRDELSYMRPQHRAVNLLNRLKTKLTVESHKTEIDEAIQSLSNV